MSATYQIERIIKGAVEHIECCGIEEAVSAKEALDHSEYAPTGQEYYSATEIGVEENPETAFRDVEE